MFASNYLVSIFHQTYVLFLLSVKTPDWKSWPCFAKVPFCTLYPDIPKGTGLDYTHTHWVSEPWSLNADLLKESFVGHLGELVWQGSRYRLLFRSRLSCRQVHRLCCEGPLISGGRGGAHPASDKAYPAYHNLSLLITHLYPSVHCTALPPRWWAYTRWPTFTSAVHTQCPLEMISFISLTL